MPPRRRQRQSDPQNISSPASNANPSGSGSSPSRPSTHFEADDDGVPPFLNTTFSTHRVSPIYVGSQPLTQDRMRVLSQRLRDLLIGDVVRGVEIGLDRAADDGAMRRAGALEVVAMGWVRLESLVGRYVLGNDEEVPQDVSPDGSTSTVQATATPGKRRGLHISMQYENTECVALLLPTLRPRRSATTKTPDATTTSASLFSFAAGRPDADDNDFLHLPLLLLRMPAPLKTIIADFISRTFDCKISSLSLGTQSLVRALERWIAESKAPTTGPLAKDVMLTLGFYTPAVTQSQRKAEKEQMEDQEEENEAQAREMTVGLKSIDVAISNSDLRRFVKAGQTQESKRRQALGQAPSNGTASIYGDAFGPVKRRRLGGDKAEESWAWRNENLLWPLHFTEALAQYVREHLALDMFHPAVRVTKIACGGFVLSESRAKVFGAAPSREGDDALSDTKQRAVWAVLDVLLERADVKPLPNSLGGTAVEAA